jgi:3-oxoacyl-[acyl-carrier-protein] synthase II
MSHEPGRRRVVITGAGVISPLGFSPQELWQALAEGRSAVGEVPHVDLTPFRVHIGGAIRNFDARRFVPDPKSLKLMTRGVRMGVAACELAVKDSGLNAATLDPARIACFVGSPGHSGDRDEVLPALAAATRNGDLDLGIFGGEGIATINPLWLLKSLANIVLYFVSLRLGAQGYNGNICMSGAGGSMAVGEAFRAIRDGRADAAVAGGYETMLEEERLESFQTSGLVYTGNGDPTRASCPFDRRHRGFVPAEGAGFVVLEEAEAASARGAKIYGEITGFGVANPGVPAPVAETAETFLSAMNAALGDARRDAWEMDAIFAYGLSTERSDRAEAEALKQLLTARAAYVPIAAVKSMTGHLVAGSGPVEVIAAAGTLGGANALPPILNCENPDPDLGLALLRERGRKENIRRVLLNAGSLAGPVASLVLEQPPESINAQ